jgi:hypothetical protein
MGAGSGTAHVVEEEVMPRTSAQKRRPTITDLNADQRSIYDALPEPLKEKYLRDLPDIAVASAQSRKKAQLIQDRIVLLDRVVSDLQGHKQHLNQLAKELESGADADSVDLRQELKPPSINGVAMRYVRPRRGS